MALCRFLYASTVVMTLLRGGCHSQKPACGQVPVNNRVVGGQDASPGSWPWLASFNGDNGALCAGSLIDNQWVLTAAHCLNRNGPLPLIFLGRHSQSALYFDEVAMTPDRIVRHPSYNSLTSENDICLLKLSSPVAFTDHIQPVCLASAGSTFHSGVSSWVAGFGDTEDGSFSGADILQEVNLPIVGNNECRCAYPGLTENMICAGFREGEKDACQGDSGGPLVTKDVSAWVQSGIMSFGNDYAQPLTTPVVCTRVSDYQEWITDITNSSLLGFVTHTSSGVDSDLNSTCYQFTDSVFDSVFDSGVNVTHFSHFTSLCLLVISLYVLVGEP